MSARMMFDTVHQVAKKKIKISFSELKHISHRHRRRKRKEKKRMKYNICLL
jgi:hypothetical protein